MEHEIDTQRSERILAELRIAYPGKKAFDLDGRGMHFVCEVEPTADHPEYDRAVEVIISSKPHMHKEMTQEYTILDGELTLYIGDKVVNLVEGDTYTITPETVHWAESEGECWLEIYSRPGWTAEDHIPVSDL